MYNVYSPCHPLLKEWSNRVKERDNWTCKHCGKTQLSGNGCHSHHIMDKKIYPEYMYDLDNGITLCISCHMKLHNTGKNNPFYGKHHNGDIKLIMREYKLGTTQSKEHISKRIKKLNKRIQQLSRETLTIINEFQSMKIASEKTGIQKQSISACCRGKIKSCGGYFWRYAE